MNDITSLSGGESFVDPLTVNGSGSVDNSGASQPGVSDAWLSARLGNAIDIGVDRIINGPQTMQGTTAYGIDPLTGRTYVLGQPSTVQTLNGVPAGQVSPGLMLVGLVLLLLVLHPGHAK